MLILLLVIFVLVIFILQKTLARHSQKYVHYEGEVNAVLLKPDEDFSYTSYVSNYGRLPVFYCGLMELFHRDASICEDDAWKKKHIRTGISGSSTNYHFVLMPHKRLKNVIHLAFPARGVYKVGRYVLETGDFLGTKTENLAEDISQTVVVMPKRDESLAIKQALSGYLGEESVRRFILEDPVLTIGFREYTGREPMKSIAWKQSARSNQLLVKEYDHTSEKSVGVILNLENATEEEVERCFEITRTVCEELEKQKFAYDFYTNGKLIGPLGAISWLPEGLGASHFNAIMYAMGKSSGICLQSFENLLMDCKSKRKTSKGYIIITPKNLPEYRRLLDEFQAQCGQEICVLEGGKFV